MNLEQFKADVEMHRRLQKGDTCNQDNATGEETGRAFDTRTPAQ